MPQSEYCRVIEETKEQLRTLKSTNVAFEYDLNKSANSLDKNIWTNQVLVIHDYLKLERKINERSSQNVSLRIQVKLNE